MLYRESGSTMINPFLGELEEIGNQVADVQRLVAVAKEADDIEALREVADCIDGIFDDLSYSVGALSNMMEAF